jgi:phenylpropionate dioxygenase-like ring-hydroxylating dioxygenase large terminal subunit
MEVRALNSVFALWRDPTTGKPVCHEAFCPHLGANLAVGGKVGGGCEWEKKKKKNFN